MDESARVVVPWDLDRLSEKRLRAVYTALQSFAARLLEWGEEVPSCWYAPGHQVHRFAALLYWFERVNRPRTLVLDPETGKERIDPAASARDAAEWFASPWGLTGMRDVWRQKGCKAGRDVHGDEPTPSLEQVIRQHAVRNARRQRPASPSPAENRQ